jgi:hypothetical protein
LESTVSPPTELDLQDALRSLRQKQGTWVEWGRHCQLLQKAGYSSQVIFEETGFEAVHQNQLIVANQVYVSMVNGGAEPELLTYFQQRGSDILYEFRILTQTDRIAAAALVIAKKLDTDDAHELARATKDFSRLITLPDGFTSNPGDAMTYFCWKSARQQSDLPSRSRLIAKGLKFAYSETARQQLEQLLVDFSVVSSQPAPTLPVYRLESVQDLSRVLPVVGRMPITADEIQSVPVVEEVGAFRMVHFSGTGAWVAVPGWRIILTADDPVALLCRVEDLPQFPVKLTTDAQEEVMAVIDRGQRNWDAKSYFVVDQSGQVSFQWFDSPPSCKVLGQLLLIIRPKRIVDEDLTKDPWQVDE